jgi:hypothetical protein
MSSYLMLGPVLFEGFELPGSIVFGGAQRIALHRLPGGARVVDAMGRDDATIVWSGTFSGSDATLRARVVDELRAEGLPLPLLWESFAYLVVIESFVGNYEFENWVPYQIACTVVTGEAAVFTQATMSLTANISADLQAASVGADTTAAFQALAAPGAATQGTAAYGIATASVSATQAAAETGLSQSGTALLTATDPVAAAMAAGTAAQYASALGFLGRAATNLAGAVS